MPGLLVQSRRESVIRGIPCRRFLYYFGAVNFGSVLLLEEAIIQYEGVRHLPSAWRVCKQIPCRRLSTAQNVTADLVYCSYVRLDSLWLKMSLICLDS